ncbi:hypothetical protein QZH41_019476 [Actinostola sp. cb2023]|nr:hypothetical protein QZH41_019476 [Actinostola sp. cb2023]
MANPPRIRNYPDLRYKFIRGLIKHEHQQRRHQFLKQAAEWTSKAIVSLTITPDPIRSAKQATQLEGVGAIIRARLDKIQAENIAKSDPPIPGLQRVGEPLVPESDLKEACLAICEEKFNKAEPSIDGAPVLCPAWWRINVLISRGFVKKRTRGKKAVYELLPEGEEVARRLRGNHLPPVRIRNPKPPQSPNTASAQSNKKASSSRKKAQESSHASSSPASTSTSKFQGPLYCHDNGNDGIIMLVDNHELGGDRMRLGELSRRLKDWNVQHKTTHLPCGDYLWLWRQKGKEITLPVLVERKRADDLAESIKDGRFCSQKDRMIQWREEFGILCDEVSLHYIVESTPEAYRVRCMDGCNGVAKCGNPTVEQVEVVISELKKSPDFDLIRTENIETTVEYLASVTAELQRRVSNGDFEVLRLMKQDHSATPSARRGKAPSTSSFRVSSTVTQNAMATHSPPSVSTTTRSPLSVSMTTHSPNSNLKATPSFSRTKNDVRQSNGTKASYRHSDYACLDDSLPQSKMEMPCSTNSAGSKRRYVPIDIDDIIEEKPKKCKQEFVDLCDSQDDDLLLQSPFEYHRTNSFADSSELDRSSSLSPKNRTPHDNTDRKSPSRQATNQKDQTNANHDEEAIIMSIRDVMPDASLDDILSALSSARGNVDLAVAMLLDKLSNP